MSLNIDKKEICFIYLYIKKKTEVQIKEQLIVRITNQNQIQNNFTNQIKEYFINKNNKEIASNKIAIIQ